MRLASKVFLATSLVIMVLVGIGAWSLRAVSEFVGVNQTILSRSMPALRLETSLRESMLALVRLEIRYAVLRDAAYGQLWDNRAAGAASDLERLEPLLTTAAEMRRFRKSSAAFTAYRDLVAKHREQLRGASRSAPDPPPETRAAAARTERALDLLTEATYQALARSQDVAGMLQRRMWNAVVLALPLAVLAGLAGAALLAFGMTRSLRLLAEGATRIAEGTFSERVVLQSGDEIAELAQTFNRMAERLGEVDRMKEEFFAHISHELRTPLTAVREATNLLRDEIPGPLSPKQARLVEIVRASSERVLGLVNQILELSRLEAGLLAFNRDWVDLDKLVASALEELRPQAEARGLVLARNGARPAGGVIGDRDRLLQVLVNLLSNAIKFTPPGGSVRVSTAERGDQVEISVEDTGVGIARDALPRVFDRYWQASGNRGGSGLGLAIVKSIVQAHAGTVRAESREGEGSRFRVRLPRRGSPA